MKEINIGAVLIKKRREKGITQEMLADYIGVSKTAVSKWETGQSYPDVTFLPLLASYFDITLDELLDYHPQMNDEQISVLYHRLCKDFTIRPFEEVLEECHQIIHKYFSCYHLLQYMGILLINHAMLAKPAARVHEIYEEARELMRRIRIESDELRNRQAALELEVYCDLILEEPNEALKILEGIQPINTNALLANAYFMTKKVDQAELAVQVDMFQGLGILFQESLLYLQIHMQEEAVFEETLQQLFTLDRCFSVMQMHPGAMLPVYMVGIQGYVMQGKKEKALDLVETYVHLVLHEIDSYEIKGIGMFSRIEEWIKKQPVQIELPRDVKTIKQSAVSGIVDNPTLAILKDDERFQQLCKQLKEGIEHE